MVEGYFHRHRIFRHFMGRRRLVVCTLLGVVLLGLLPRDWRIETRMLLAWNVGVVAYLASAIHLMMSVSSTHMRRMAQLTDESRFVVLTLAILAAMASIIAIVAQLATAKYMVGSAKFTHLALAGFTIFSSWSFIHLIFAQHYAHEFFIEREAKQASSDHPRSGLSFPGTPAPDFIDFLYFAFVIGVASQTADVSISSRPMRRVALVHCVLSFFFNATILALTINIAAGLI
jgi:uncharacterized membrane protein